MAGHDWIHCSEDDSVVLSHVECLEESHRSFICVVYQNVFVYLLLPKLNLLGGNLEITLAISLTGSIFGNSSGMKSTTLVVWQ